MLALATTSVVAAKEAGVARDGYNGCPPGSVGAFSIFGFLTFLLALLNLLVNSSKRTIVIIVMLKSIS